MPEWSTDSVHPRESYSYWREAICKWVFNTAIEAPPGPFSARLTSRASGPLRIAAGESSAYMLVRNRRELDAAPSDEYCIYLQRRSVGTIEQGDQSCTYQANDVGLSDLRLPFRTMHADGGRRIVAMVPCELIDRRAPWVAKTALRKFGANSTYVDLARRHMVAMAENEMSDSAMALLTENLCNLIALASAEDIAPKRMQAELQIEAMLAFCRQHLQDTELTPQRVADHLGVSLRTMHSRFKQIGQSFGRWVLEERLKACGAALRDPLQAGLNISEIAYRWGFNDLSHFNKSFRARYDRTPAEWRNALES
jgi:AraC family transcriptional regulator, positive regulator of tynA and feaB